MRPVHISWVLGSSFALSFDHFSRETLTKVIYGDALAQCFGSQTSSKSENITSKVISTTGVATASRRQPDVEHGLLTGARCSRHLVPAFLEVGEAQVERGKSPAVRVVSPAASILPNAPNRHLHLQQRRQTGICGTSACWPFTRSPSVRRCSGESAVSRVPHYLYP